MQQIKAINAVWLAGTDLSNLNSGIGGSNLVDVKKYKSQGIDYPYASGQAMRYYLKEAIRRRIEPEDYCIPNDKGETCGDIRKCILCDLFGFMTTLKEKGATTRVSPIKMSPAMGLLPLSDNLTIDFLTRRKPQKEAGKLSGDIVDVELSVNLYKAGLSIDFVKIGGEEEINIEARKSAGIKYYLKKKDKKKRVKLALESFKHISDFSKQARVLTDFSPDIILLSIQSTYNHLIQKSLELKEISENDKKRRIKEINCDRLDEVLTGLSGEKVYAGILSGSIDNSEEVKGVLLSKHKIAIKTPMEAINEVISQI